MTKRWIYFISCMSIIFFILLFFIVNGFEVIKNRYKDMEPNLDNYSTAELLYISFERVKTSLLNKPDNDYSDYEMKLSVFNSKLRILESYTVFSNSFFYDQEFSSLVSKLKSQLFRYDEKSKRMLKGEYTKDQVVLAMEPINDTLLNLQEVIYRIQIKNFTEVKEIIKDNSEKTEILTIIALSLIFSMIVIIIANYCKLKLILKEKNIFISSIYHELASSAQSIIIAMDVITYNIQQQNLKKEVGMISYHTSKILAKTKEIMDYSKLELGEMKIDETSFCIGDMINNAVRELNNSNNNVFYIKCASTKKVINTDKHKTHRIIMNLLENANKYTHHGRIFISVKILPGKLYIRVKDNGIGFDIKKINFLYTAFNQGIETETTQGLGLGLTIVKHYVKSLNGIIRAKSKKAFGSSFLIFIPLHSVKKQP